MYRLCVMKLVKHVGRVWFHLEKLPASQHNRFVFCKKDSRARQHATREAIQIPTAEERYLGRIQLRISLSASPRCHQGFWPLHMDPTCIDKYKLMLARSQSKYLSKNRYHRDGSTSDKQSYTNFARLDGDKAMSHGQSQTLLNMRLLRCGGYAGFELCVE